VQLASALLAAEESGEGDGSWWGTESAYPIIPHPAELIVGLIAFAILYWVVKTKVAPRFEELFAARAEAIEGGINRAEKAQAEAQAALEEYRTQLADARKEAARIREEAREQGTAIVVEMREQAQADARRITEQAQQQIANDRQQAFQQLTSQVGRMAVDLAGRIVGESLEDEARQRRTVERFLSEIEASEADGAAGDGHTRTPAGAGER
jgi:F-type H+-transporting ATPase subunit b